MLSKGLIWSGLACLIAVALAVPLPIKIEVEIDESSASKPQPKPTPKPHPKPSPPSPTPEPGTCASYTILGECLADQCCNWCNLAYNTSDTFCMETIPWQQPGLSCIKEVTACEKLSDKAGCEQLKQCSWVPMGETGLGVCVYELAGCAPPSPHKKPHPHPKPPKPHPPKPHPPKPHPPMDHSCNSTVEEECNMDDCCHWCHEAPKSESDSAFDDDKPEPTPTPKPGFCMKIGGYPIPSLTCSKQKEGDCKAHNKAKSCNKYKPLCSWISFGPPGQKDGPGMCSFNWTHCATPKFSSSEYELSQDQQ